MAFDPTAFGYTNQQAIDWLGNVDNKDAIAGMGEQYDFDAADLSAWGDTQGLDFSSEQITEYSGLPGGTVAPIEVPPVEPSAPAPVTPSPEFKHVLSPGPPSAQRLPATVPDMPTTPVTPEAPSSMADLMAEQNKTPIDIYNWAMSIRSDGNAAQTLARWGITDMDEFANIVNLGMEQAGKWDGVGYTGQTIRDRLSSFLPPDYFEGMNEGELTPPGSIDIHEGLNARLPGWFDRLEYGIPNYFDAFEGVKGLPGLIDEQTSNRLNQSRVTGDNVKKAINAVMNQRYGRGLPGGTESSELMARVQGGLIKGEQERRDKILSSADAQKIQAISQLPGQALLPTQLLNNLFGISAGESGQWGGIMANMINSMY